MIARHRCDSCGELVADPTRLRHVECTPPPLPAAFYEARERARRAAENRTNR